MKIKMSKSQWDIIGRKTGWIKSAQASLDGLYDKYQMKRVEKPVYVSLYERFRSYGGAEEGGWWYDENNLVSTKKFFDKDEAEAFAESIRGKIKSEGLNDEDLGSARGFDTYPDLSGGDPSYDHSDSDIPVGFSGDVKKHYVIVEDFPGSMETKERPRYE